MKKTRSWHFYTLIITISAVILLRFLWEYTPLKNEVEAAIMARLKPYLGESFLINDFSLGFSHVSFYGIRAAGEGESFSLELEEIRIDFSLYKLAQSRFSVPEMIEGVTFRAPALHVYNPGDFQRDTTDVSPEEVLEEILANMKRFPAIDHIAVTGGQFRWHIEADPGMQWAPDDPAAHRLRSREILVFDDLEGRLNYQLDTEQASISLRGRLTGIEESNVILESEFDFANRDWVVDLHLEECNITSDWPFWKIDFFVLEEAWLKGDVRVVNHGFSLDSLSFSGTIGVRDFRTQLFNQYMAADTMTLRLRDQGLIIDPFELRVEEGNGQFWGTIDNIFSMEVDWYATLENYPVRRLRQSHSIFDYAETGTARGEGHFFGPIRQVQIEARATCPEMLYAVIPFEDLEVKLYYDNIEKQLDFPYFRAWFMDFRTQGDGGVNLRSDRIELKMTSDVAVPNEYFSLLNGLNGGEILLYTDLHGDVSAKDYQGQFHYVVQRPDSTLATGSGPFTLDDQLFSTSLASNAPTDAFRVRCTIENLFSDPNFNILDIKSFPVSQFTLNPLLQAWISERHTHFYFAGPYESLFAKMKIVENDQLTELITATANIREIFLEDQKFRGGFTLQTSPRQLSGTYSIDFSAGGMGVVVDAPDIANCDLYFGATSGSPVRGKAVIHKLSITEFLQNSPVLAELFDEGTITGDLAVSGTVNNPELHFGLSMEDVIVNDVGYYRTRFTGSMVNHELAFKDALVTLNGDSVFYADFYWHVLKDSLQMAIGARGIESNFLAETIFEDRKIIRGSFDYTLVGEGSLGAPRLRGNVVVHDGYFAGNPFYEMSLVVQDSLLPGAYFWDINNHLILVDEFLYQSHDHYRVEGEGLVSIDQYGDLDLKVSVEGNVLAELPQLEPYFMNPQSDGSLYAHIRGSRANPYFQEVSLLIREGSLEFDGVLPKLTDLRADVRLSDAGNFVEIREISGNLQGRWARVYNVPQVGSQLPRLQPWVFEDVRLNFGVLVLETDPAGIPLSLPGMMKEGDVGYLAAAGKQPGEKFYFAGPVSVPIARGSITMYNCRVTFPFIGMEYIDGEFVYAEGSGFEDSKVVDFLLNMEWDVTAVPGNNNRYFVDIPAYVGEVYLDLNIDNNSPGFEFTGRLVDDSFRTEGSAESSRGRVEYLDVNFRVDRFGAEFNSFEILPEVYGRAYTTVRDTASNFPRDIYLQLYVTDPVTGDEVSKGRWEDFRFKLVSRDQVYGETQEQILAYLGYSVQNIQYKAGEVGLTMTENFLIRPLFRPIERQIEKHFRLDYVRLRSQITQNLFYLSFQDRAQLISRPTSYNPDPYVNTNLNPALSLLQSMELTMGKYVAREVYFSYSGQLVAGYEESRLGMNHTLGMEYRVLYNLLLQLEYSKFRFNPFYNEDINRDLRVLVRHSFNF